MSISLDLMDFRGKWTLERDIQSEIAGQSGRFSGQAEFVEDGEGLAYFERGTLEITGGGRLNAERSYLWRSDGEWISVYFDDGRPFHNFTLQQSEAAHFCDPDTYRVSYEFDKWPRWSSKWRVEGPRKDYVMLNRFTREPS